MVAGPNFVMLHVPNVEEVLGFYSGTLGMEIDSQQPGFVQFKYNGSGAMFSLGVEPDPNPVQGTQAAELWWFVENADTTHDELVAKGVPVVEPLTDMPFGRTFTIKDPAGNKLYMLQTA